MKRLASMLAAGLIAAATVVATAGAASAGPTPAHRITCSGGTLTSIFVQQGTTQFFPGVPNKFQSGSAVILKATANGTSTWCFFQIPSGVNAGQWTIATLNGGLAMTSGSAVPGRNVTVTTNNAFASQRWNLVINFPTVTIQNVKTGLFLRVRNSGPALGQTVTTGNMATVWTFGIA
jgi:ricin-type beta-trefoil lectin protein